MYSYGDFGVSTREMGFPRGNANSLRGFGVSPWQYQLLKGIWCFPVGMPTPYGELVFLRGNWGFPVGVPTPYGDLVFLRRKYIF